MAQPQRADLQALLETLVDDVYFQPPTNVSLRFPCIIYKRNTDWVKHADNDLHLRMLQYEVTVIDRDPDSMIPVEVAKLPMCRFQRHFTADDLNHDVYNLYWKGM